MSRLKIIPCMLLCVLLMACNGGSNATPQGNIADDDADKPPVASLSIKDALGAKDPLTVTFSKPMDSASLSLGGTLAGHGDAEWISDDTLEFTARTYWPPGAQTLVVDANDANGRAMKTLEAHFNVKSAFATFQKADVVIGQQDFSGGLSRQNPDAPTAGAHTLDFPGSAVAYAEERNLLFIADTGDSRVLGFHGIPDVNNANADFVIGQPDFSSSTGATSQSQMRTPQGISAEGGRLIVGDPNSNRLMIYDGIPESGPGMASVVVGQETFDTHDDSCGPGNLNHVHNHFVTPAGRLLIADGVNDRVLVWNRIPDRNGPTPDLVIGQSSLDLCAANDDNQDGITSEGEQPSARTLQHPTGIWSDDERLVIADNYNNRVLIWNEFPTKNFTPADVVLGQASMQSIVPNDDDQDGTMDAGASARVLNYPWSVWVENGQLFVADENNSRVLIWNEWPEASFTPADIVIGQKNFEMHAINGGKEMPSADTLNHPKGVRVIGERLLITDYGNSRVLILAAE